MLLQQHQLYPLLVGLILTGGIVGAAGAAELGLRGESIGYVAASTAAGTPIIASATTLCALSTILGYAGARAFANKKKTNAAQATSTDDSPILEGQQAQTELTRTNYSTMQMQ